MKRASRVYLEPISPARREEFLRLARASRSFHRKWVAPPATPKTFAAYMDRIGDESFRCFYVCRREDGALLGVVNISQIVRRLFQSAYLGYYVFAPYARQGYLGEGLALALAEAFRKIRLHRVEANLQSGNAPSRKLVKRLGFRKEGFSLRYLRIAGKWTDHERWAMTVEDWKKASRKA